MKYKLLNKLLILIIGIIIFIPYQVKAVSLASSKIGADLVVKTGDTFTIPLYLDFTEIDSKDLNSFGIAAVGIKLSYDTDTIKLLEATATSFTTELDDDNNTISILSTEDLLNNNCADNILYCSNYNISYTFYMNDTANENTKIKIEEVTLYGWKLENGKRDSYLEKDLLKYTNKIDKTATISIKKAEIKEEPNITIKKVDSNKKEANIASAINKKIEQHNNIATIDNTKSNNNYLSKLEVEGYLIDFYKRTNEYDLEVAKNVNKLYVDATLEDKTATLEIIGANDIKANNNKIEIIVTAENGTKNTYVINIIKDENTKKETTLINKLKDFYNKYKMYIIIGASGLLLIIIILAIVNKVSDKRLDNKIDNF